MNVTVYPLAMLPELLAVIGDQGDECLLVEQVAIPESVDEFPNHLVDVGDLGRVQPCELLTILRSDRPIGCDQIAQIAGIPGCWASIGERFG